jgi:hypothetical protein
VRAAHLQSKTQTSITQDMDGTFQAQWLEESRVGIILDLDKGKGKGKDKGKVKGKAIEDKEGVIKKLKLRLKVAKAGKARSGGDSSYDGEGLANWWQLQAGYPDPVSLG